MDLLHKSVYALATGFVADAFALYGASLVVRRRQHHTLAVGFGLAGGVTATVGGYLGGHLTLARKVGTADPAFTHPSAT
ncbi:hypothetical protein [Parafrankia sp. FMc2]|uniref:hypothetical protein n=1 Tax=Parafrankia sp. FMc2 TaxID=3233196 RepID=UPI0034D4A8E6